MAAFKPPGQCPVCGEWVPRGAAACDDCGACAKSGWKANADIYDGVDLPDDDFDYDDFIQREFGNTSSSRPGISKQTFWRIVAAIVLGVMILGYLLSAR
jgi:hypothetical protein